jgi:hypothetical protein
VFHQQNPAGLVRHGRPFGQVRQCLGRLLPRFLISQQLFPGVGVLFGRCQISRGEELFDRRVTGVQRDLRGPLDLRAACADQHLHPSAVLHGSLLRALGGRGVALLGDCPAVGQELGAVNRRTCQHTIDLGPQIRASRAAQRLDGGGVLSVGLRLARRSSCLRGVQTSVEEGHDRGTAAVERGFGGVPDFHVLGQFGVVRHELPEPWVTGVRHPDLAVPFLVRIGRHRAWILGGSRHSYAERRWRRGRGLHKPREHGDRQRRRQYASDRSHFASP